jgi:hypothetical protein
MLGEAWLALKYTRFRSKYYNSFLSAEHATHTREKNVRIFLLVPFTIRSNSSANRRSKSETRDGEPFGVVKTA